MLKPKSFCPCVFFCLTIAGIMALPASARAGSVGILVPAYFYPGTGGSDGYTDGWAEMAAAAGKVPLIAIFNPNSGPLPGPADPNYVTALTNLENAGGHVVAYIPSSFGTSSASMCRRCRRTTSTASAARRGPRKRATPLCSSRPPRRSRWRRSSGTSGSGYRG